MRISLRDIKEKYPEFEILNYDEDLTFETFNHDSRVRVENSLFIPLIGDTFNGHDFVQAAFDNGAVLSLYQRDQIEKKNEYTKPLIVVDSIEEGLEKIVKLLMERIEVPVVAITGSTGKTTTREMLAKILSLKGKVLSSDRNYNTLWGNAQLLSQYDNHDYVVLEFGMDRAGEIAWQCRAIEPDIGILLNVGHVHAQLLGSIEDIYLAKKELADYLSSEKKPLILNIDDERLARISDEYKGKLISVSSFNADYAFSNVSVDESGTSFDLKYEGSTEQISMPVLGKGYAYNAISAIACAKEMGFTVQECKEQLKSYEGFNGRFFIKKISDSMIVVDDAYNANPTSMKMSLETFEEIWGKRTDVEKILILGEMRELGDVAEEEHEKLGELVKQMNVDKVYYIGAYYEDFGFGEELDDPSAVKKILQEIKESNTPTVVLVKAGHIFLLSEIVDEI